MATSNKHILPAKNTPGALRRIHLSDDENYTLLTVLAKNYKTTNFDVIANLFDDKLLYFLDLFAGENIQVPKRKDLEKLILYTRVYHYLDTRQFAEDAVKSAAKIFDVTQNDIEKIRTFMEDILSEEEV